MDLRPPFTVTGKILRTKADGKSSEAPRGKVKEPITINRESSKRVFGTVRNQNVITKAVTEKPTRKPGILPHKPAKKPINSGEIQETNGGTPKKPLESTHLATTKKKSVKFRESNEEFKEKILQGADVPWAGAETQETNGTPKKPLEATTKKKSVKFRENNEEIKEKILPGAETPSKSPFSAKPRNKRANFSDKMEENKENTLQEDDVSGAGAQTPLRSPFLIKPNASGTPYHSAERCSKCRFDKLETSSYWLGQIRLSESVRKHFVSAAFFRLASECKAEPIRNMKIELKKYLGRNEHLSGENEWKDLCFSYGLMKEESNITQDTAIVGDDQDDEKQVMNNVNPVSCETCGSG